MCAGTDVPPFLPGPLAAQSVPGPQSGDGGARAGSERAPLPRAPVPAWGPGCLQLGSRVLEARKIGGFCPRVGRPAAAEWGLCSRRELLKREREEKRDEYPHLFGAVCFRRGPTRLGGCRCPTQTSHLCACRGTGPMAATPCYRKQDTDSHLNWDSVAGGQRGHA